jgi:hypothetical protein
VRFARRVHGHASEEQGQGNGVERGGASGRAVMSGRRRRWRFVGRWQEWQCERRERRWQGLQHVLLQWRGRRKQGGGWWALLVYSPVVMAIDMCWLNDQTSVGVFPAKRRSRAGAARHAGGQERLVGYVEEQLALYSLEAPAAQEEEQ